MDFNYAPPPPGKRARAGENPLNVKKQKFASALADLPTHLPNQVSAPSRPSPKLQEPQVQEEPSDSAPDRPHVPGEPIFIEGTSIVLQTDEDIAKWIEERKKNWPTRKNVEAKLKNQQEKNETAKPEQKGPRKLNVCKFFARNRKCRFGNKCKNLHEASNHPQSNNNSRVKVINGLEVAVPQRYKNDPASNNKSFYKKLVQRDLYEHENNKVLDFLLYLDSQGKINHDVNA